jgi:hypothetical protein
MLASVHHVFQMVPQLLEEIASGRRAGGSATCSTASEPVARFSPNLVRGERGSDQIRIILNPEMAP